MIATASLSTGAGNRPLTNMPFYYKLGFKATDENMHTQILNCISKNEPVPLSLNCMVKIELDI